MLRVQRKIVFINQATGYLTIDIINEFAKEFEGVALITGSIRVQHTFLDKKVNTSKIVKYNRGNILKKSVSWLLGTIQIFFLLLFRYRGYDKVYFTIPPIAYLLAPFFNSKYSIVIYDLHPDALLTYGMSKKGLIFRCWSARNSKIFGHAFLIYTLSEPMRMRILEYSPLSDVRVIPNWTAFSGHQRIGKNENKLMQENALNGKFIVQYSGNIGLTHEVEVLVEIAEKLKSYDEIVFLIIGRGKRTQDIQKLIQKKGLNNCKMLPFRKDDELYDSLCAADISVITLDDKAPDISVPSKTFNIMAAGVPIMGIASVDSAIAELIIRHQIGGIFDKRDLSGMCRFILDLRNEPRTWSVYSSNSLHAAQQYSVENAREYVTAYLES